MSVISVFDVLGPVMVGPSSSHTAGAAAIAGLAYHMMGCEVKNVEFILYGSFARTYRGHGTDRALLGGIMGFAPDDRRIPRSFEIAEERNLAYSFQTDETNTDVHPNTVDIIMTGANGRKLTVRGESLGGGKAHITGINNVEVDFTGEYNSLIVIQRDMPGVIAHVAECFSTKQVNIAFLRLFREAKGETAFCLVEYDGILPECAVDEIRQNEYVYDVMLIQTRKENGHGL